MKIVLFFILTTLLINNGFSQEVVTKNIEIRYTFNPVGKAKKVKFTCLIPNNLYLTQHIKNLTYSIPPKTVFTANGNKYAQFILDSLNQKIDLIINLTIDLYNKDFSSSNKKVKHLTHSLDLFLINEEFIEISDSTIINLSKKLKRNKPLKTVKHIYQFVHENIKYSGYNSTSIGAAKTLKYGHGDCTEFTDLFVALCRASGIPAKVTVGYTTTFDNSPLHSWPEVYLNKYGWVRFDPTSNNAIDFSNLHNKYIQLSSIRNDSLLSHYQRWTCKFWGKKFVINEEIKVVNN